MARFTVKDRIGDKIGSITIIKRGNNYPRKNKSKETFYITWIGKCECGSEKEYSSSVLCNGIKNLAKGGKIFSCGCKKRKEEGKSAYNRVFFNYKHHAEKRGYKFLLTEEKL